MSGNPGNPSSPFPDPIPSPARPHGDSADRRPLIGITMGDPGGIGAEVIVKALADPEIRRLARFVIFGLNELLAYAADLAEIEPFWWRDQHERFCPHAHSSAGEGFARQPSPRAVIPFASHAYPHDVVVLDYDEFSILGLDARGPTKAAGQASMQFVTDAVHAAMRRRIDAVVTGPICKESWQLAGFGRWPGHTELLAEKTKARRFAMMFAAPPPMPAGQNGADPATRRHGDAVKETPSATPENRNSLSPQSSVLSTHKGLRVVLATIHEPLFELRHKFKIGTVFDPIDLAHQALIDWFGIEKPRIAVCGLNPHASENGLFGDEEKRIIEPAILMARQHGIDAAGPFPADTIFLKAVQGQYDLVVAMYHDQGLIPVKLLDFNNTVNLTLGLPIVRTSPDHGTAFDIAGKNKADPGSIKSAIRMAAQIAATRAAFPPLQTP